MQSLTKEQRAAKFASNNVRDTHGLRSRGHRKLSLEEQQALLKELKGQPPQQRLDTLRVLREAVRSSDHPNTELERTIYEHSAEEYIRMRDFANVVHILGHLCTIANVSSYWRKLYAVALINTKQFQTALQYCQEQLEEQYLFSVLNMDIPLWKSLTSQQTDQICQILMSQILPEVEAYTKQLEFAYRQVRHHP